MTMKNAARKRVYGLRLIPTQAMHMEKKFFILKNIDIDFFNLFFKNLNIRILHGTYDMQPTPVNSFDNI